MITYWNDLQNLHDIQNQLIIEEKKHNNYTDKDIE